MESRLHALLEVLAAALVTSDTAVEAKAVGIIVMTGQAVDRRVLPVRKIERNEVRRLHCGFAQRRCRGVPQEPAKNQNRDRHAAEHQSRMPAEYELPARSGSGAACATRLAAPQQHQNRPRRRREKQRPAPSPARIPGRRHHMRGRQCGEQATEQHVRGLEASMTGPKSAPDEGHRGQNDGQQHDRRGNAGHLVERSRGLQVLDHHAVRENEAADMQRQRDQCGPADERMQTQRQQGRRHRVARPQRRATQDDAA